MVPWATQALVRSPPPSLDIQHWHPPHQHWQRMTWPLSGEVQNGTGQNMPFRQNDTSGETEKGTGTLVKSSVPLPPTSKAYKGRLRKALGLQQNLLLCLTPPPQCNGTAYLLVACTCRDCVVWCSPVLSATILISFDAFGNQMTNFPKWNLLCCAMFWLWCGGFVWVLPLSYFRGELIHDKISQK